METGFDERGVRRSDLVAKAAQAEFLAASVLVTELG
jgi:hypothetical protein